MKLLRRAYRFLFILVMGYHRPGTIVRKLPRRRPILGVEDPLEGKLGITVGHWYGPGFVFPSRTVTGTKVTFGGEPILCYNWEIEVIE